MKRAGLLRETGLLQSAQGVMYLQYILLVAVLGIGGIAGSRLRGGSLDAKVQAAKVQAAKVQAKDGPEATGEDPEAYVQRQVAVRVKPAKTDPTTENTAKSQAR